MLYFLILLKNKLNGETVEATILKDEQSGKVNIQFVLTFQLKKKLN